MVEENGAKEMARMISCLVDNPNVNRGMKSLVDELLALHPTLQQAVFGTLVLGFVEKVANADEKGFDGRNVAMRKACVEIMKSLVEAGLAYVDVNGEFRAFGMPFR